MRAPDYIELHARSAFNFLRGASQPEALAEAAAEAGLPGLAVCDRDGVYGAPRVYKAAREQGLRAIVGAELTLEDGSALPVLVETRQGYQNLCQLITKAQLRSAKGEARVRYDELPPSADGLIALTGDEEGPVQTAWRSGGASAVAAVLGKLEEAFPANGDIGSSRLIVEIQRHMIRDETRPNRFLFDLVESRNLAAIATNGVNHATAAGREVMDVFTCLRHHTHLDAAGKLLSLNAERQVKSAAQMARLFPEHLGLLANTRVLADRLEFSLENLGYEFPRYKVPQGETMESFLRKLSWFGAEQRYGSITPKIRQQIEHELALINKLGFAGYFLIVWDIVNHCREEGILVQGRGSAANSAVCYSLGITAVDPIGGKLLFERFLSEGRKSWPDIDLDLPSGDRRESAIQEVYRRYGKHGAAMTANVITYRGRSAVREIGKVLNFSDELVGKFSTLFASGDYRHTLEFQNQLEMSGIRRDHPRTGALVRLYDQIYGLPRHLGQHSGGMIICEHQLSSVVPLENASMPGRVVAQWDKDDCEDMGIIKVDLLGLGMMAVLQDSLEITRQRGHPVDLAHIPKDDPATFDLMQRADTIGVFQIESRAQMATLPRMKPRTFYDVAIEVAIIRPGPIQGNMVHPYLERRNGRQEVDYIDDRLKPILERTLGVCLFQEQILQIAMVMADFTGSEAEELRRALNFHRSPERLEKVSQKLRTAMERKGIAPETRERIVEALGSFALYGFPESHAVSFALLAYASCYLKVHYPAEFYTGLLNNQPMGFYSPSTLVQDARRHGMRFLPPCVMVSQWGCEVIDEETIRLGICYVKGVGEKNTLAMIAQRDRKPFADARDFLRRTSFSRDERRALANVGALNALSGHRRDALWEMEEDVAGMELFSWADDTAEGEPEVATETHAMEPPAGEVVSLSEDEVATGIRALPIRESRLTAMNRMERLRADYEGMGLTVGSHPMGYIREAMNARGIWRAADLPQGRNGARIKVGGAVICRQRPGTAKGFVFISLEDETGVSNAVVRPKLFEEMRLVITQEPFLMITGILQLIDSTVAIRAETIEPLAYEEELPEAASHDFH